MWHLCNDCGNEFSDDDFPGAEECPLCESADIDDEVIDDSNAPDHRREEERKN